MESAQSSTFRVLSLRAPRGHLEIDLHPSPLGPPHGAAEREASVQGARAARPRLQVRRSRGAARRARLSWRALAASTSSACTSVPRRPRSRSRLRLPRAEAIGEELLFAARSGTIVCPPARDALGRRPDRWSPTKRCWGRIRRAKHVYTVVRARRHGGAGRRRQAHLEIAGDKQDKTTDGSGKVTLEKSVSDTATVTLTNRDDLRRQALAAVVQAPRGQAVSGRPDHAGRRHPAHRAPQGAGGLAA